MKGIKIKFNSKTPEKHLSKEETLKKESKKNVSCQFI